MKLLVTGMTSRQANPDASNVGKKEVAFAWLLAEALRSMGHDVEQRDPRVVETYEEFDHVFVGMAPVHGLGANRTYGALAAIMRTWGSGRLSLYVDDPDVGKVTGGLRAQTRDPDKVVKPFFAYRKEYEAASKPGYAEWLQAGVRMLNEQQWPRLIVPAHPWFSGMDKIVSKVPQAIGYTTTLDLTAYLPEITIKDLGDDEGPAHQWVCEAGPNDKWLRQQQPGAEVYRIGKDGKKKLPDTHLVNLYCRSLGVLQPPVEPVGWWNSRIGYARQALVPYVTRWQDVQALGEDYTVLPHTISLMDQDARDTLVQSQAESFDKAIPGRELCESYLNEIVAPAPLHAPEEVTA